MCSLGHEKLALQSDSESDVSSHGGSHRAKKRKHAPRSQVLPDLESEIDTCTSGLPMSESDGNNNEHEDDVISQQEEEASLASASVFSASDGSDNDFSDHTNQTSAIEKWRFDPTGGKDEHSWHLLRGQDAFTTKYFSEYVGESAIK